MKKFLGMLILGLCINAYATINPGEPVNGITSGDVSNLAVKSVNDEDIDVNAALIQIGRVSATSVDVTILTDGTAGANALDTGSIAADTWYYIFLIAKVDGTVAGLASLSSTAPTMPTDYVYKRRVGSFLTDATSDIIVFNMSSYGLFYYDDAYAVLTSGTQTDWTAVDCSAYVPPTRTTMIVFVNANDDNDGTCGTFMKATGSTDYGTRIWNRATGATVSGLASTVVTRHNSTLRNFPGGPG